MRTPQALKSFAKKLVELSTEKGRISEERVSAVLQAICKHPSRDLKPLLKYYLTYIRREVAKAEGTIDYAGPIGKDTIALLEDSVAHYYGRPIALSLQEAPELLAGLRIRVSDDVWERSAANILNTLKQSF